MKRIILLLLAVLGTFTLVACGDAKDEELVIGVAHYSDNGHAIDAIKEFMNSVGEELNFRVIYTVLTQTDEAQNLTKIQELISAGVDGILLSMDLGMPSIMQEAKEAGIYVAGFLSDFDDSYQNTYDAVYKNEYFLGTVADGFVFDNIQRGKSFFQSLLAYNEANSADPILHVSMVVFPKFAFPGHHLMAEQFINEVDEYNKTADQKITVDPLDAEVDVTNFRPISSTYFSKHPDIDAIMSLASGGVFVYPPMVTAGVQNDIKLFTAGWETGMENNFGTFGTGTFVHTEVSATESIVYPLVLMLNKLRGKEFTDMPEVAQRVSVAPMLISSPDALATFKNSIYFTGKFANSILTAQDVLALTAYGNSNATYANLVATLDNLGISNIK